MTKTPRWMKSVIAVSTETLPALPWARGTRRKPAMQEPQAIRSAAPAPRAIAAH